MYFRLIMLCGMIGSFQARSQITQVMNQDGDQMGRTLAFPIAAVADSQGNLYVAGADSDNVFRLDATDTCHTEPTDCSWTEVINTSAAGKPGQILNHPRALAVDSEDHIYVVGRFSDNAWRINNPQHCNTSTQPCEIHEIINNNGDGEHDFDGPFDLAVDHLDHVYVTGTSSNNIFRIEASSTCDTQNQPCTITEIADGTGDGSNNLFQPGQVVTDEFGHVYVSNFSDNVLKINQPEDCSTSQSNCVINEIMSDDDFPQLNLGSGMATDNNNHVYVSSLGSNTGPQVFRITSPNQCLNGQGLCEIVEVYSGLSGQQAVGLDFDDANNLFIAGGNGNMTLKVDQPDNCDVLTPCKENVLIDVTGDGENSLTSVRNVKVLHRDIYVLGADSDNVFKIAGVADLSDVIFADDFD